MASPHYVVATRIYMKNEIIKLREQGKSYSEISKITSKSISTIRYQCSPHQRQCAQLRKSKHRKKNLLKLKMLAGGKCKKCGYSRCFNNLSFHHIDPTTKNKKFDSISALLRHSSFQKTYEETQKCVLLCANCHGELHAELIQ